LKINIFNHIIVKIIKRWYLENTYQDEFNNILYTNLNVYFYLLVEKYDQMKIHQQCTIINRLTYYGREVDMTVCFQTFSFWTTKNNNHCIILILIFVLLFLVLFKIYHKNYYEKQQKNNNCWITLIFSIDFFLSTRFILNWQTKSTFWTKKNIMIEHLNISF
jgi:hypothetical protein